MDSPQSAQSSPASCVEPGLRSSRAALYPGPIGVAIVPQADRPRLSEVRAALRVFTSAKSSPADFIVPPKARVAAFPSDRPSFRVRVSALKAAPARPTQCLMQDTNRRRTLPGQPLTGVSPSTSRPAPGVKRPCFFKCPCAVKRLQLSVVLYRASRSCRRRVSRPPWPLMHSEQPNRLRPLLPHKPLWLGVATAVAEPPPFYSWLRFKSSPRARHEPPRWALLGWP